ncbi:MAG: HAMP domain-containing protein [Flavobacteriales bacterium]|nr:HAMP domain-containing protein [Flavobacteriales bacterium]
MAWRFADLPVRTKFLVTLGIPVLGLVLLIGKQVDGSLKRRDVLRYINIQARNIDRLAGLLHELQEENAQSIAYLGGVQVNQPRLELQHSRTDAAAQRLNDPELALSQEVQGANALTGISLLRQRVSEQRINLGDADQSYRQMRTALLEDLSRVAKLALDPETKDRLYSHLSLLNSTDALANVRTSLGRGFTNGWLPAGDLGWLYDQLARYSTSLYLFERDAPAEVLAAFRETYQGPDVNFVRTVIGTVQEKRSLTGLNVGAEEWKQHSDQAMAKLDDVEAISIARIVEATDANRRDAESRLFIVLFALFGVVSAVGIMAYVIMRGIRRTVSEITEAAGALAEGDIRVAVPVTSDDEFGTMARSFNRMIENVRALSDSAEAIGKGNYDTPVPVRGPDDVLGVALTRMKENLRAARTMDAEQKAALQQEKAKLEQANVRINVLIKEIHHRVKNNLQVVASLLRLQRATIDDERLQEVFDQSQNRVASMALIHEKLYRGDELVHLDLGVYIKELFAELIQLNNVRDTIRYTAQVEPGLIFDLTTMVPLGLVLNELITNSFKHAFKGRDGGAISLTVQRAAEGAFDLLYADDGVGIPQEKISSEGSNTLGVSLIESLVEQMNGRLSVESSPQGTKYHIRFRAE